MARYYVRIKAGKHKRWREIHFASKAEAVAMCDAIKLQTPAKTFCKYREFELVHTSDNQGMRCGMIDPSANLNAWIHGIER